ncbi:transcriptional regulator [Streptomyces libani subsp. rufus]|nr:transcriptional regulator [Streptomyces libani subsp. rufus]
MANVIDITGLPPERVVFTPSPLAELGAALHALSEPGHHPGLHGWVTATNAALKTDLADRLCEADILWRSSRSDILLPARPGATLAEDLDELDKIDDERFVAAAFEITCSPRYTRPTPSPLVDAGERARIREMAAARGPRQAAFTDRMLTDPDGLRVWLRRLFEDCEEAFFGDIWRRVGIQLAADARHKTELLRRKGLAETLSATSRALWLEDAQDRSGSGSGSGSGNGSTRIVLDKLAQGRTTAFADPADPGVTFLPTSFGWPHLVFAHAQGWRPVLQYPVASPELPAPAALELVQQRLEALGHPMRMQLCRTLSRGPHSTGELAEAFGITSPEVSRHIATLKKAGLIQTRRRGRYVLHQLDLQVVARLGSDFLEGVLR